MVSTPNVEQLKEACGSDELHHCFKFLFVQERAEGEGFIQQMGEKCDALRRTIEKRQEIIQEAETFSPFDEVAGDALDFLNETQDRERGILAGLIAVLDLAREGRVEKEHHIVVMDLND